MEFVTVYSEATGRKQRVPAHYLDNPVLSRGLSRPPSAVVKDRLAGDPDDSWTVAQLTTYATDHGIDLDGATRKNDVLAAISAAGPTPDTDATPVPVETPAAGEEE